ncbi:DoxX family protein [bacterium]|nr:DoxX family protein [bacterium]MCI0606987.1 DoxX family protein [bacterium]
MPDSLYEFGWCILRIAIGYVYLYALYRNTRDPAARQWLIDHTAYMFAKKPEPQRTQMAKLFAIAGMLMMFLGGVSVLAGVEPRIGALLLFFFTAGGIYQHRLESVVAMDTAQRLNNQIPENLKADLATLQWSAFSGHFSSRLKNWGLCGVCAFIACSGNIPNTYAWILATK